MVVNISGNCFLLTNEQAYSLLTQGSYLVKGQVVQNSHLSAAINTFLFCKRTYGVSSLIACTLGDDLLFLDLSDGGLFPLLS
jgi:hypothetical protein